MPTARVPFPLRAIAIDLPTSAEVDNNRLPFPISSGRHVTGIPNYYNTYMPTKKHLRPKRLLKRMGSDFNAHWMSIEKPFSAGAAMTSSPTSFDASLTAALRTLNFTYTAEGGGRVAMRPGVRRTLERWLLERAACRVRYTWRDLGVLFWPRWLRQGECKTLRAGASGYDAELGDADDCSWPPGMHCVTSASRKAHLLRWRCQGRRRRGGGRKRKRRKRKRKRNRKRRKGSGRKSGGRRHKAATRGHGDSGATRPGRRGGMKRKLVCRWVKVNYPITVKCACAC